MVGGKAANAGARLNTRSIRAAVRRNWLIHSPWFVLKNQKWHLKARFSDSKFQEAVIIKWGCKL